MASENKIIPFSEFMDSVRSARHEHYVGKKGNRVANEAAFMNMKEHLINYYQGTEVLHSFSDGSSAFDCIPAEQQPSLKHSSQKLAKPPGDWPGKTGTNENLRVVRVESPFGPNRKDRFGNTMFCPPGTIALRRITLDELARFETLRQFFQKNPFWDGCTPTPPAAFHRHAWGAQIVDATGGHSILSVHQPLVNTGQLGHAFSLSQHWYTSSLTDISHIQTVELGWIVFPQRYFDAQTHFFVYWTPDNYCHGYYDLDQPAGTPGFVYQPAGPAGYPPGHIIDPVSNGGNTVELELAVHVHDDKWWIWVGGTDEAHAIGYFPTSLFNNGPMASKASQITYGGEVATNTSSWPPMGNGNEPPVFHPPPIHWPRPDAGVPMPFAYHRDINYLDVNGQGHVFLLNSSDTSPSCYNIAGSDFGTIWYGGRQGGNTGGTDCDPDVIH